MEKLTLINLTPHPLNMYMDGMLKEIITPTGPPARVGVERIKIGYLNEYPVSKVTFLEVENMPEPEEGLVYIVSAIVADALKDKGRSEDIYAIDELIRDGEGVIKGASSFKK